MAKVNYRTAQGFTYRSGSVLQCSMVNPDNHITRACYQAALEGKPIPHTLRGPGFQKAEIGMALAQAVLADTAVKLGLPVQETSSQPAGWSPLWNLAELQAYASDVPALDLAPQLVESPAPMALLTAGDKAEAIETGEIIAVSGNTISATVVTDAVPEAPEGWASVGTDTPQDPTPDSLDF